MLQDSVVPQLEPDSQTSSTSLWASSVSASLSQASSDFKPSQEVIQGKREALDTFLIACGHSPVKKTLTADWQSCSTKTKSFYTRKLSQVMEAAAEVLSPNQSDQLSRTFISNQKGSASTSVVPEAKGLDLLEAMAKMYARMNSPDSKKQVLSLMVNTFSLKETKKFMPGVTRHHFRVARKHCEQFGAGAPVPKEKIVRTRISEVQIEHFLSFVMSPHILQDMPFGESVLHLSDGRQVQVPKVILTMIPASIIQQYQQFCNETTFEPPCSRTLRRMLDACSTTYR